MRAHWKEESSEERLAWPQPVSFSSSLFPLLMENLLFHCCGVSCVQARPLWIESPETMSQNKYSLLKLFLSDLWSQNWERHPTPSSLVFAMWQRHYSWSHKRILFTSLGSVCHLVNCFSSPFSFCSYRTIVKRVWEYLTLYYRFLSLKPFSNSLECTQVLKWILSLISI